MPLSLSLVFHFNQHTTEFAEVANRACYRGLLNVLRAHPKLTPQRHEPALVAFLRHGFNDDLTATSFADIRRLAPATQITVSGDAIAALPKTYWKFPNPAPLRLSRDEEYIERFRDVLGDAVRDRLRSARAAIMLSGGLDSTSLAATARRVSPGTRLVAWSSSERLLASWQIQDS